MSNLRTEFSALNIRVLISSWEDREINVLENNWKKGDGGKPRRSSDIFNQLSKLFKEGNARDERGEALAWARQGCDNQMQNPTNFQNLTGVEESKGGGKFGNFLGIRSKENVREYRVLRCDAEWRGRSQLVNTTSDSTNRKRARDPKVEISDLNITPCKKMKV